MISKDTLIKVVNRDSGVVGYTIPELNNLHRNFYPNETKQITFGQLEQLSFIPGGSTILEEFLEIADKEAARLILHGEPEPEYFYSEDDVKRIMIFGSLDEFLDCLDFAPQVVKTMIKDLAVSLPLNDVEKRNAIKDKLGFDVTRVIEIKNTKYDGDTDENNNATGSKRRAAVPSKSPVPAATGRRYQPQKKEN